MSDLSANELAQYLEEQMSGWATDLVLREAANMLRQQQERLAKYELRNIAQCDRIAILEAQLKQAQNERK